MKDVRENCISPKKNGSFAFCTKLLKESYDIALLCRGSCPSSLTPTTPAPTNAPSVCGPPSLNVATIELDILVRLVTSCLFSYQAKVLYSFIEQILFIVDCGVYLRFNEYLIEPKRF